MKTKILAVFLALTPLISAAQINYAVSGSIAYVSSSPNASGNIVIASIYNSKPVKYISVNAFFACQNLTGVVIPSGITNIGNGAFESCHNLTNVAIPNSVTTIGDFAFEWCTNLPAVTIPNTVVSIGQQAFEHCDSLTSIVVPDSVTNIETYVVNLSGWIGYAFSDCAHLTNAVIGNGLADLADYTFYNCPKLTNVIIGTNVTRIGEQAFGECSNLTSINIPNRVGMIDLGAFDESGLTSITLPKGVTNLSRLPGGLVLGNCANLTNILVDASNSAYSSLNGVLFDQNQTTLVKFPGGVGGNYVVPIGVTNLGANPFYYCTKLKGITFQTNAPPLNDNNNYGSYIFSGDSATIYYFYGTTGWGRTYCSLPAVMLGAPVPLVGGGGSVNVQAGVFGFGVTGVSNQTVVVEASTNLVNWQAIWTNTLSGTNINFTDPQWTNYPSRYYRAR